MVSFDRAMCVLFGNVDEGRWEEDKEIANMLTGGGGDEGEEVEEGDEQGPHLKLAGARRGGVLGMGRSREAC